MVDEDVIETEPKAEPGTGTLSGEDTLYDPEDSAELAGENPVAHLIVKRNGALTDSIFELHPPATIGRFDSSIGPIDVDLTNLPEAMYVSRKHAAIVFEEGVWKVRDLGSSNGTFLLRADFEPVTEGELEDGSEFALGNARFVFKLGPVPA